MIIITYLFRNARATLFFVTLAGLLSGFSGAGLAKLVGDGMTGGGQGTTQALLFFGLCIVFILTKSYAEITVMKLSQRTISALRIDLCLQLLRTPLSNLQSIGRSELLVILTNDVPSFLSASQRLPAAFGNSVIILACFGYMAYLSWEMFLVFAAYLLLSSLAYYLAERKPRTQLGMLREQIFQQYKNFTNLIDGSRELKLNAHRGAMFVEHIIRPDSQKFEDLSIDTNSAYTWVGNAGILLFYLFIGLILFVMPRWSALPSEMFVTFILMLVFLMRPIGELTSTIPLIRKAETSLKRIWKLEGALASAEPAPGSGEAFHDSGPVRLELRDVCLRYRGSEGTQFTLGPLNLQIHQGEILYIAGGNGSGKTSLAMLLLGLYMPDSGAMMLRGQAVTKDNLSEYRQFFSAILADFHLFEHVAEPGAGLDDKAQSYIEQFGIAHKVKVHDGKFSTIDLSTGQRKRLALVSAYLEDRPIYLFDEWAADQDPVFKKLFYTELLPGLKSRGKTVIVITHDDSYFGFADRVIKLEDGNLTNLDLGRDLRTNAA